MDSLEMMHCEVCRVGAPQVTEEQSAELQRQIPAWTIMEVDGVKRLERLFRVKNFVQALELANRVGAAAEQEGHHPALVVEWGKLEVIWWTHKIKGLHQNDFIMAAKTDQLYEEFSQEVQK